jgi:hypothetical protein
MHVPGFLPVCLEIQESPQVAKTKKLPHERGGKAYNPNRSSDFVVDSPSIKSAGCNFEAEGHARLVQMIESKYLASRLKYYHYPGRPEERNGSSSSLRSLKSAGKYDLRAQNEGREEPAGLTLQQLDFTKLLKRRGRPLNSEREAMVTRIDLQNICPSNRHQKSGLFSLEKRTPRGPTQQKQFKDTFLKGFLKRINLNKDKDAKHHAVKKNFVSAVKLKSAVSPPFKDKSSVFGNKPQEATSQRKFLKPSKGPKDISRRDLLLQYLKDSRVSIEKLQPRNPLEKYHKPGRSTCYPSSKNSHRDRAAFSSLVIDKPTNHSKTQKSTSKEKKKEREKSCSFKKSKSRGSMNGHTATESVIRLSKSFTKGKKQSSKPKCFKSKSKERDHSGSSPSKALVKSKYSTKFTAITKLVIKNQKAYLNFDERPKSDRFF